MACDLCGKSSVGLESVNDIFRTENVCMICPSCANEANKQIAKIQGATSKLFRNLVKEWMKNKCSEWRVLSATDKKDREL